ncbi:MAG: cobalamin biosynthesis protein CbiX [Verrucomicrobia bacterium]|nr:cobalamin biosynthesis protein CbiX [Verrucomicrobiota bacterium]
MPNPDLTDAALVLAGHGSTLNADSAAPTFQHADALRRRGTFAQVVETFWKQEPHWAGALRGVFASRVFIVPLFISEGYFTEDVLPREMGFAPSTEAGFPRTRRTPTQTIHYCGPVGTHDTMTGVILARAREVVDAHPFPRRPADRDTALFVAGHGTGNNENSRKAIERQVGRIRALGPFAEVHAVFMEEEPRIASCWQMAEARNLVVVPFFISDGLHSYEDIPVLLGEPERVVKERFKSGQPTWRNPTGRHGKLLWYGSSVGTEPHIADVILERVREAAANPPPSTLAR